MSKLFCSFITLLNNFLPQHFLLLLGFLLIIAFIYLFILISANFTLSGLATHFFHEQPVYKQLALGWQIAKQFLELKTPWLSNNTKAKD